MTCASSTCLWRTTSAGSCTWPGRSTATAVAFEPDPYAVADALAAVRPNVFPSVPRVYEKVHTAIVGAFDEATGARRRLVDWALAVGREVGSLRQRGEPLPRGLALKHRVADRLVYAKVKARLGGRLRLPISGGAPLGKEVAELFDALDIRIMEGYGLTECTSAATSNHLEAYRYGTVGKALPGFELRLAPDGELEMRSETIFAGYYQDADGDGRGARRRGLAADGRHRHDRRGRLRHDHRPQEGHHRHRGWQEHRTPEPRERSQGVPLRVTGARGRRPQTVPGGADHARPRGDREMGGRASGRGHRRGARAGRADRRDRAGGSWTTSIATARRFEQIKRFVVLPRDFEPEQGEITPTLKLKRRVCLDHFATEVEALYADAGGDAAGDAG